MKQFLARQLNDHRESQRGVRQPTYFTWSESHIEEAIEMASNFLIGLIPQEFSEIKSLKIDVPDCVVSFCGDCDKFLGLVSLSTANKKCIELTQQDKDDKKKNDLLSLLTTDCYADSQTEADEPDSYSYQILDSSNCIVRFDTELPKGTEIRYSCLKRPDPKDLISDSSKAEYMPIVAEYAMYWLYRTDSESRTNLARAQEHRQMLVTLVQTKLLIDFSLVEDDYVYGNRKVNNDTARVRTVSS